MFDYIFCFCVLSVAGCATVPCVDTPGSDARGVALLRAAADAAGDRTLIYKHNIGVHLDGRWSPLIARIQPTLVDDRFRGTSDEQYWLNPATTIQAHHGSGGNKTVFRDAASHVTRVSYNGKPNTDREVVDAAALVADGYRMFLLGPKFFEERHADVRYLKCLSIDGHACDDLLITLHPGIGTSEADRVVISVDCQSHLIRRYRMTVNGLANAPTAVADIFCYDYIRFDGFAVPTRFFEELKNPFDVSVHHWRLTTVEFDQDFEPAATPCSTPSVSTAPR